MRAVAAISFLVVAMSSSEFVAISPLDAKAAQSNPSSGVLTLDDTMANLGRLISRSKVTATASNGGAFADPAQVDRATLTSSKFQFDKDQPCLITFDEVTSLHYSNDPSAGKNAGKTINTGERHFVWMPAIDATKLVVTDLKTWANNDEISDSSVPGSPKATYSGFVLITKHSAEVIAVAPIKKDFPNPSSYHPIRQADRIFFATRTDAEDAKQLLTHAASVTRNLTGSQHCVRR
jgi:hypothetical protein